MKPKLTPVVLVFGLALTSVIGTIIRPAAHTKAAISAPANGGLTVTKLGSGSGTIKSVNYPGINCGTDCYDFYGNPLDVILSATASLDSAFTGWGGYCSGTVMTCTVSMINDTEVTASFTLIYTATVAKEGNGSGTVTSSPAGIDCGTICSASFYSDTVVTFTAALDTGSQFSGWTGDCAADGLACVTTMSAAKDITATFALITHTVSVTREGNGSGSVTSDPAGIDCGAICSTSFNDNTVVTLTAAVDSGSLFGGWAGDCAAGRLVCVTTMTATRDITATFALITYTLSVTKTGDGSGSIASDPRGIDCGDTCSAGFDHNTVVTLTAVPITGSQVSGWAGDCSVDGLVCVTTMTTAKNVTATFHLITTNLAVSQSYTRRTGAITFTVVVVNHGPTEASGAIVSDTIPPDITRPQWSCRAANGASCPNVSASMSDASCRNTLGQIAEASGSGYLIHEVLPALPVGGIVTYTIKGNICMYISELVNQVVVIPPDSVTDISHIDNTATITTGYRVMVPIVLKN